MTIKDKMLRAYFRVAEHIDEDTSITATKHYFHRTKKNVFAVVAERLDKNGLLPGEFRVKK